MKIDYETLSFEEMLEKEDAQKTLHNMINETFKYIENKTFIPI